MIDKTQQFHISRLEKEKGKRTKCFVEIASYHLMGKHASFVCISRAKKLILNSTQYRKLDRANQTLMGLKNEIAILNACLRIAIEKDSSGELINLLELEKFENSKKEELLMKEKIAFDDLPRIDSFSVAYVKHKEKLSLFDKVLFGKFSKGYTKAEYRNPKRNDFITKGELSS